MNIEDRLKEEWSMTDEQWLAQYGVENRYVEPLKIAPTDLFYGLVILVIVIVATF